MSDPRWDGQRNLEVSIRGPAAVVTLMRPEKYNALSFELMVELSETLHELEELDEVRGVVLTGGPSFFSTGGDLNEALEVTDPVQYRSYNRHWRQLTETIEHLWKPVIAAIDGYCTTGGVEIALACDIRIAGGDAKFAITSSKIGSVAGVGGTQRLPRVVGRSAAKRMLFSASFMSAEEALNIGLVDEVVEAGRATAAAEDEVAGWVDNAPLSIAWHKMAVNTGMNLDLESALDFEAALSAQAFSSEDKREGMSAFLEKRSAVFRGR